MGWTTPRRMRLARYSRGRVQILVGLVAAAVGGCCPDPSDPRDLSKQLPANPDLNVLVVSFDALRTDSLGVYGNELGATPNLDALARDSLVFENAYTSGPATLSSFGGAFSGRLPIHALRRHRMVARPTLAELFAAGGYVTAGFLNNPLTLRFRRGFAHFSGRYPDHSDEAVLQDSSRWLERHASQRFFAWIHFINPHAPYDRREESEGFYTPGYVGIFAESSGLFLDRKLEPVLHKRLRELYVGEVHYADGLFGRLRSHLQNLGLEDRTVLVVTADHGEAFAEHGGYEHGYLYEEVVHIPLLVRHPHGGRGRVTTHVINVDLLPTLASIAGLEAPAGLDGHDLTQRLDSERPIVLMNLTNSLKFAMGVRLGRHKLIKWCAEPEGRRRELFDLEVDPAERDNRLEQDPGTAARLTELLHDVAGLPPCEAIARSVGGATRTEDLDEATLQQLRELGYVDEPDHD